MSSLVLKTLKHIPLMEFEVYNENHRLYPIKIAENKILTEDILKSVESKTLLGEIDHPEKRFNTNMEFVSHSIVGLELDKKKKVLYGDIDILDTPRGRILNLLTEYCNPGWSARAYGRGKRTREGEIIDIDTYRFKTFDAVVDPGFKIARTKNEGLNLFSESNFYDKLDDLYNSYNDNEKVIARNLYESLSSQGEENELLSIDNNSTKSSLSFEVPSDSEEDDTVINEGRDNHQDTNLHSSDTFTRQEELEVEIDLANSVLLEFESIVDDLKKENQNKDDKIKVFQESLQSSSNTISILREALEGKDKLLKSQYECNAQLEELVESLEWENRRLKQTYESLVESSSKTSSNSKEVTNNKNISKKSNLDNLSIVSVERPKSSNPLDYLTERLYEGMK